MVRRKDQTDQEYRNDEARGTVPMVSHTNRPPPFNDARY